jgi:hypothetical protein
MVAAVCSETTSSSLKGGWPLCDLSVPAATLVARLESHGRLMLRLHQRPHLGAGRHVPTGCADSCVCRVGVQELTGKYAHGNIAPCNYQLQVRLSGTVLALLPASSRVREPTAAMGWVLLILCWCL